jgi:hypothetical protein
MELSEKDGEETGSGERVADERTETSDAVRETAGASGAVRLPPIDPGRYHIVQEHGRGGLGRVLEVRDLRLDRTVAVKEMLRESEPAYARFVREAMITARLQHPSIVPVHDIGRWPSGAPFYSMKLVSGRSLHDVIAAAGSLALRLALLPSVTSRPARRASWAAIAAASTTSPSRPGASGWPPPAGTAPCGCGASPEAPWKPSSRTRWRCAGSPSPRGTGTISRWREWAPWCASGRPRPAPSCRGIRGRSARGWRPSPPRRSIRWSASPSPELPCVVVCPLLVPVHATPDPQEPEMKKPKETKHAKRKLSLSKETVRTLTSSDPTEGGGIKSSLCTTCTDQQPAPAPPPAKPPPK